MMLLVITASLVISSTQYQVKVIVGQGQPPAQQLEKDSQIIAQQPQQQQPTATTTTTSPTQT